MQKILTFALLMVRLAPFMSNYFTATYCLAGKVRYGVTIFEELYNLWFCTPERQRPKSPPEEGI